ncbi:MULTISPECIES: type III secretion system needle filament subunit SctF [Vibrio]|uniref:EscF/YscF/HrpA family type III secretion system needle major subunit n=2 Tax=Vibrio TaxID=662 RepID=A0A7V7THX6_9VIBR|nr:MULTISPECIES: type III secretion system needle filament subunit SctF [Vibrio]KAB0478909.1 EscF/YscF/HrpA family type III secretion system needle major subunit [Vibrio chagasii]KZX69141.1 EscF/YscF/HrpA family type III secretion system needle major subunit [Vibrio sp. HI00D65]MBJ2147726.1 type III secretion system needle filament subunit SctF [Vibrio sp. IB15]OCH47902.1 EscF/YscF/HrpA family type III secretion system needle major subunit [Vibrio lentus]PME55838.1 EscF/YscF/HrpA family type I|tara:strand:- start:395 stop:643 length:249 start_codon:yes stop_codon:yes gene_type:complete
MSFYDPSNSVYLDDVKAKLEEQAKAANEAVNVAIKNLESNADDPSKLAELQHTINKWSVIYNINATTTRAIKDVMQSILQKV